LARHRVRTLGIDERVGLHVSTDPTRLPDGIGRFDYILMSAVYEHLLPDERVALLPQLWSVLEPGGVVFLNQTPFRWFPVETHTTRLPLVNYLPDRWTLACARRFSMRVAPDESWEELLRRGIRGGTHKEIVEYLQRDERNARLLDPEFLGVEDRIALWYRMSSERRAPLLKKLLLYGFRFIRATTGQTVVPGLSLAIKKVA
jgi:2-polyprenyl-3-methyl-5-hydroxy-6-metoxy-1,4-benzoquinol methylase